MRRASISGDHQVHAWPSRESRPDGRACEHHTPWYCRNLNLVDHRRQWSNWTKMRFILFNIPPLPMSDPTLYNTEEIIRLLQLEETGADRFRGQSHFMGSPNVFGGQVLGQSLYAAVRTVDGRRPHSMHAMFLLAGNHRLPIDYEVERVRDGGSFSTRRVVAFQEGRRIFVMSASFQATEDGLSHQKD